MNSQTKEAAPIVEAAERWKRKCLIDGGSLFGDEHLWTRERFAELKRWFGGPPRHKQRLVSGEAGKATRTGLTGGEATDGRSSMGVLPDPRAQKHAPREEGQRHPDDPRVVRPSAARGPPGAGRPPWPRPRQRGNGIQHGQVARVRLPGRDHARLVLATA